MKKTRFTEMQIVKILKEVETGRLVKEVCREYGVYPRRPTTGKTSTAEWKPPTSSDSRSLKMRTDDSNECTPRLSFDRHQRLKLSLSPHDEQGSCCDCRDISRS